MVVARLSIGEVVARTGVSEGVLRTWERRHGFPCPERTAAGHRRYTEDQVELLREVVAAREAGLSVGAAIERARRVGDSTGGSIFAALRGGRPELHPLLLRKRTLLALSHAIEDESLARAQRPVLFAAFQHERFYRAAQARWRELARGAALAIVFADFERPRTSPAPAEVPLPSSSLVREWVVVCDAEGSAACLAGREPPSSNAEMPSSRRVFEVIWSVEPQIARDAARLCAALAVQAVGPLPPQVEQRMAAPPAPPAGEQLRLAAAITNRALSYLA